LNDKSTRDPISLIDIIQKGYYFNNSTLNDKRTGDPISLIDIIQKGYYFNNSTLGEGGGYDDGQLVGTMMTGTLRATAILDQIGGALTATEDELSTLTTSDTPIGTTTNTAATSTTTKYSSHRCLHATDWSK
jgi:hypothetical protein